MTTTSELGNANQTLLNHLAGLGPAGAIALLDERGLADVDFALQLAVISITRAETDLATAQRWAAIAGALNQRLADNHTQGWIHYAEARHHVLEGNLSQAEIALRAAQATWQAEADPAMMGRSNLGLTQVFAMQGCYDEAEKASAAAIAQLQEAVNQGEDYIIALATAHRNYATLLVYQERHAAALAAYAQARQLLESALAEAVRLGLPEEIQPVRLELAHVYLNQASAQMFLDQTYEAEASLQTAINIFDDPADPLNRGRARTNLGSLYLRSGRFAAAISLFDQAARDLIGDVTTAVTAPADELRHADILLLDQANAYLALNLLPEALRTLAQCETLFRAANQPYELGQTLLAFGLAQLRSGDAASAERVFVEAETLFAGLGNDFWLGRTTLALAALAAERGQHTAAAARLDRLLTQPAPAATSDSPIQWDRLLLVEARLLRLRLHLDQNELAAARQLAAAIRLDLGLPPFEMLEQSALDLVLPHLTLRLVHGLGMLERAAGNRKQALRFFHTAVALLERQRISLPIEEMRTAFLDDKSGIYADLVLTLLDRPDETAVAEAFSLVERARSRALLERLTSTMSGEAGDEPDEVAILRAELQQQLHTLYNRLLGEDGSRHMATDVSEAIRTCEAALEQTAWQGAQHLPEAHPIALATLQAALAPDQQAVVYYVAGAEVMAFVVSREQTHVRRHLCTLDALERAGAEWQFQLGRAEMDSEYQYRHAERIAQGWRSALNGLHTLVVAPLMPLLTQPRLLLVPYGMLHSLPFHALWDGEQFLLDRYECAYAPSATLAVQITSEPLLSAPFSSWAGLALNDPSIPGAKDEVMAAAHHFQPAWLYLDAQADQAGLQAAAQQADVLHLATHGLYRPDNPFFSCLKLADGWVDVRTIYRLQLRARLVVLSACDSGVGQIRNGDEIIGLARGFLALKARSLVVSLWNVHDASSVFLMDRFYAHLTSDQGVRPAAALRAAQSEAIRQMLHPYYWAQFLVLGE